MNNLRFRAWHPDNKEMVNDIHIATEYDWSVFSDGDAMAERERYDKWIIMQSTGLSDKNGKEIFCGDGIRVYIENTALDGVVEDDEENARFIINVNGNKIGFQNVNHFSSKTEIIGDIYTTPELLTKQ